MSTKKIQAKVVSADAQREAVQQEIRQLLSGRDNKVRKIRSFNLDTSVVEAVKHKAVYENRSVNNMVETLLRKAVLDL